MQTQNIKKCCIFTKSFDASFSVQGAVNYCDTANTMGKFTKNIPGN